MSDNGDEETYENLADYQEFSWGPEGDSSTIAEENTNVSSAPGAAALIFDPERRAYVAVPLAPSSTASGTSGRKEESPKEESPTDDRAAASVSGAEKADPQFLKPIKAFFPGQDIAKLSEPQVKQYVTVLTTTKSVPAQRSEATAIRAHCKDHPESEVMKNNDLKKLHDLKKALERNGRKIKQGVAAVGGAEKDDPQYLKRIKAYFPGQDIAQLSEDQVKKYVTVLQKKGVNQQHDAARAIRTHCKMHPESEAMKNHDLKDMHDFNFPEEQIKQSTIQSKLVGKERAKAKEYLLQQMSGQKRSKKEAGELDKKLAAEMEERYGIKKRTYETLKTQAGARACYSKPRGKKAQGKTIPFPKPTEISDDIAQADKSSIGSSMMPPPKWKRLKVEPLKIEPLLEGGEDLDTILSGYERDARPAGQLQREEYGKDPSSSEERLSDVYPGYGDSNFSGSGGVYSTLESDAPLESTQSAVSSDLMTHVDPILGDVFPDPLQAASDEMARFRRFRAAETQVSQSAVPFDSSVLDQYVVGQDTAPPDDVLRSGLGGSMSWDVGNVGEYDSNMPMPMYNPSYQAPQLTQSSFSLETTYPGSAPSPQLPRQGFEGTYRGPSSYRAHDFGAPREDFSFETFLHIEETANEPMSDDAALAWAIHQSQESQEMHPNLQPGTFGMPRASREQSPLLIDPELLAFDAQQGSSSMGLAGRERAAGQPQPSSQLQRQPTPPASTLSELQERSLRQARPGQEGSRYNLRGSGQQGPSRTQGPSSWYRSQ